MSNLPTTFTFPQYVQTINSSLRNDDSYESADDDNAPFNNFANEGIEQSIMRDMSVVDHFKIQGIWGVSQSQTDDSSNTD
jgi:hypothetical protein